MFRTDTLKIQWSQSTPGWNGFDLDTPFSFEGSSNLIVELQYMGSLPKYIILKAAAEPSGDRCLDGDYPTSPNGTNMPFYNCMRIHYTTNGISEETDEPGELSLTPEVNPLSIIQLSAVSQEETQGVITAYGIDGRSLGIVWEGMLHSGENSIMGDRSGLPSGVCFLVLKTGESRALARILLLR